MSTVRRGLSGADAVMHDPLAISHPFKAMGGPCELRLYGVGAPEAAAIAAAVEGEVRRLELRYSRYRDDSITAQINATAGTGRSLEVDPESAALLNYAQTAWEQSEGLFDITSGVLRRIWNFKQPRLPTQAEIDAVRPLIGWQKVSWCDPRISLPERGMEVDFGGYVKEYAADRAVAVAREQGARHGFVDLAGDIAVIGPHPDQSPLAVGIRDPKRPEVAIAVIPMRYGAIASSGSYERYFEHEGRRYCHILDPLTGWPISDEIASVSVIADACLVAGTATTIAMLKGRVEGTKWLDALGLPYVLVDPAGAVSMGKMEQDEI